MERETAEAGVGGHGREARVGRIATGIDGREAGTEVGETESQVGGIGKGEGGAQRGRRIETD